MTKIRYIKDGDNNNFYPVTHEKGVRDSSGTTLDTKLAQKQATLVSGSNIKTINSTSVLGSGNITVQETLVSGTNIKTINGSSILGSGNISVGGGSGPIPDDVEVTEHKVTTISAASTNVQYPSAKAVYDHVESLEDLIGDIDTVLDNIIG